METCGGSGKGTHNRLKMALTIAYDEEIREVI